MTRFFFEIVVDDLYPDPQGLDLPNQATAHSHAIAIAASHLHEADRVSGKRTVRVVIKDDAGETVEVITSVLDQ